ncbi:MAG: GDP-mannose dehydrogenase [Ignisphaera sp.]|nr:GDP-mannose dehydrogenase [Ignisphaera sp.]MCX8168125.1 GDP-mannose dehydrogenase [Ignisphaera sp.]MDW8085440.1 GDP-mannose dehydrogenase [Ignisphaera sp.]
MDKVVVIGLGEVGRAVYHILKSSMKYEIYGYDIDPSKTLNKYEELPQQVDLLHITFPYSGKFTEQVCGYVERFRPKMVVIHSTVVPGTTRKIFQKINITTVFSPVRGKHPNLVKHLYFWPKWIVSLPSSEVEKAVQHLNLAGFKVRVYKGAPESIELAKLWETVYRAIMIASWQEIHRVARIYGAEIEAIAEFIGEVHKVLGDRPIYYPDHIGGHCLIPNTKILNEAYPSKLFEFVLKSNELRLKELNNEDIKKEVERVKEIVLRFINKEYYE